MQLNDPVLQMTGAAVTMAGRPILRAIDLSVDAGQVVAILGANGSGKSTLVRALLGLQPLSAGQVRLFGRPLGAFDQWQRLGYVPQRSTIAQGVPATVSEVVASGRVARRRPFMLPRPADREAVRRAIGVVGLSDRAGHAVATLSGGQQQRVLMARTLAGDPELLFLDEPNAGVDLVSQQAIADVLAGLSEQGATLVVVLHELGPFAPLINRTIVLREGRLAYDGPPDPALTEDHGHHHLPDTPTQVPGVRAPLEGRQS